jgi:hypothetical protein
MRPAPGPTYRVEPLDMQRIEDRQGVGGAIGHRAAGMAIGVSRAGPRIADQA